MSCTQILTKTNSNFLVQKPFAEKGFDGTSIETSERSQD
jgi:hypothetical protein